MSRADRSVQTDEDFVSSGAALTRLRRRSRSFAFQGSATANGVVRKSHRFPELILMRRRIFRRTANDCSFLQSDRLNRIQTAEIGTFGSSTRLTITGATRRR